AARPPASCSGTAARPPDGPAATPTSPGPPRAPGGGSTAAAPAAGGPPARSARSTPARRPTFFRRPIGPLPPHRQDGVGQQGQRDVAVPAGPTPHLVVGQPGLLLGRLEGPLDRPPRPGGLGQPGQRRPPRAGR